VELKRKITNELRKTMKLSAALKYLNLSKSSYSYTSCNADKPKRVYVLDSELSDALRGLTGYELTIGCKKTTTYVRQKHKCVWNHKKVYRHMESLKLLQPKRIKRRWIKNKRLSFSCPIASNVRWEADMTFVPTGIGSTYLFIVEDVYDREVIGGQMSLQAGAREAVKSLEEAVDKRFGVGNRAEGLHLTVRVDRGCQYTAEAFETFALSRGINLEFCGVQTPNDKPYIESFIGCYKSEEVYRNDYTSFFEAYEGWKNYLEWYNYHRPHGSLGNVSPVSFKESKLSTIKA